MERQQCIEAQLEEAAAGQRAAFEAPTRRVQEWGRGADAGAGEGDQVCRYAIGDMVHALKNAGIYDSTLVILSAKHGERLIDPSLFVADGANSPAALLGSAIPASESPLTPGGIGATEDDVSVLWLKKGVSVTAAVKTLEENAAAIG